jgi:Predicted transmembrane transcriptional regulator (anti-sigma factor)
MEVKLDKLCEKNLVAAYVDGELDTTVHVRFEEHLIDCQECRLELRVHRQFICELDALLANDVQIPVPVNFSRVVAARAVSDMSGVRTRSENRKALIFCVILGAAGFALLGSATRVMMIGVVRVFVKKLISFVDLISHAVYDLVASVAVISRVLSRKLIVDTGDARVVLLLLVFAVFVLSRLISGYHRTDAIE